MTKRTYIAAGVAVVVAIIVGAMWLGGSGADESTGASDSQAEFEAVEIRDLEEVTTLSGTLGFPEGEPIGSRLQGTITAVVAAGTIVTEGEVLYEVDGEPVALLIGTSPAFRDLGEAPLTATIPAGHAGVVTSLPEVDESIGSGSEVFRISDAPTILLPGQLPAWRNLQSASQGADVLQLEEALVALGFDPSGAITVDDYFASATGDAISRLQIATGLDDDGRFTLGDAVFFPGPVTVADVRAAVGDSVGAASPILVVQTGSEPIEGGDVLQLQQALGRLGYASPTTGVLDDSTTAAIVAWQTDIGAVADGVVDLGEVVFLPGPVRVTEAAVTVGKPVNNGSNVLSTSESQSVVLVELDASNQDLLAVDQIVQVEMPDRSVVDAVVTDIDRIARRTNSGEVVFDVTIQILDTSVGADLDQAPVDVLIVTDSRSQVVAVPVTALLALAEGGYAVEVDRGNGVTALVGVDPGLYADGWVEVITTGLAAGDMVVVP
jgi:peptidoglycan hydrolase-like protein with peptidoglycan-binding domain